MTKKQNPDLLAAAVQIPPEVHAAISAADDALAAEPRTKAAIQANERAIAEAQADWERASQSLADIEAKLLLIDDETEARQLEAEAAAAAEVEAQAIANLERRKRVGQAIAAKVQDFDQAVKDARNMLEIEVGLMNGAVVEAIAAELGEACKLLVRVLRRAQAAQTAIRSQGLAIALGEIRVPNPSSDYFGYFIESGRVSIEGEAAAVIRWEDDPTAVALAETLRPIVEARQRLSAYVPARNRQKPTATGYTIRGNDKAYGTATPPQAAGKALQPPLEGNTAAVAVAEFMPE